MKKGQIIPLPLDNTSGVIVRINILLWASCYYVLPLYSSGFYNQGEVEQVLINDEDFCSYYL